MLNLKTQKLKNTNGITLVALVITIIILLILAGISISALTNQGLFGRAKEAKERKVQNLKIEDIQNKMKTDYTTINSNYGNRFTLSNKYYPSILTKEKGQKVTVGQNTTTETELDLSEQKTFENQTESKLADTLDVKVTYWYKIMSVNDFDGENKEMYYKLFINNGSNYNTYWMSSRCVNAHSSNTNFNVRYVDSGNIGAFGLYDSNVIEGSGGCAFRPIVTLNSNVQVTSGDGSINSQYNIQ